ncbi:hypothetical protein CerSpe_177640 [Prunus speciosa]
MNWFKTSTRNDESRLLLYTLSAILASTWCAWLWMKKSSNKIPPLPPGPLGMPLLGNLLSLDPELHSYFAGLAHTYGPIFKLRLGPMTCVVINSPSSAREVLKDRDVTFANRDVPVAARIAFYGGVDVVWTPHGPEWRMLRKVAMLKMLGGAALDSVQSIRQKHVRKTVGYLYGRAGYPVNLGEQIFLTLLNVISNMIWGGGVVAEDGEERARIGAEFRKVVSEITGLIGRPNVSDFFPGLGRFDLQGIKKQMEGLVRRLDGIFEQMIDQRLRMEEEGAKESQDFLTFLLKLKEEGGDSKTPLTMTHLKALLMDMMLGGTDTSSNTAEFAFAETMNKPAVMGKAKQELDDVVGKDSIVQETHISKLPYLQAVVKETLRLHPILPLLIPHCPSETCTVGGYTIPKGSRVLVNAWAIHRDPSNWEDPLDFDPDRFLHGKWDYSGSDFKYLPFGSGRRICAGTAMAERIVVYTLATLLHSFDWKLPQGEELDLSEKFGIVMKKKIPLVLIPTPRLSDPALYE